MLSKEIIKKERCNVIGLPMLIFIPKISDLLLIFPLLIKYLIHRLTIRKVEQVI